MNSMSDIEMWDYELYHFIIAMKHELECLREDKAERVAKMQEMRAQLEDYKKEFGPTTKAAKENKRYWERFNACQEGRLLNDHVVEFYISQPEPKPEPFIAHPDYVTIYLDWN